MTDVPMKNKGYVNGNTLCKYKYTIYDKHKVKDIFRNRKSFRLFQ